LADVCNHNNNDDDDAFCIMTATENKGKLIMRNEKISS
jgi:hypothetical protein